MRIALTYSPWLLSHRGGELPLEGYRDDPKGLSGSEMCAMRLYEELRDAGHHVSCCWPGAAGYEYRLGGDEYDAAISVNCPDDLRGVKAKVRVCYALLNDWTFCRVGFEEHTDLFVSPSSAHLEQCLGNEAWKKVECSPDHPNGKAQWDPNSKPWVTIPLGCDPDRYVYGPAGALAKVPGRVVYTSSPDRGLHWLLQEWPAIRRAVPDATLRIFYRVKEWIRGFESMPYYPPIEPLRARALYVDEALRRLEGQGVELHDAVSRNQMDQELAQAQVQAYPCDPTNHFTEGFSCSTLEACAAKACPVIFDSDALGSIYRDAAVVVKRGDMTAWRAQVIRALTDEQWRAEVNERAYGFARSHTWRQTAEKLMASVRQHLSAKSE